MPKKDFLITASFGSRQRLDVFLTEKLSELTRSHIQKLISRGEVRVNGEAGKPNTKLKKGDRVEIEYELTEPMRMKAEDIPLDVIYRDEHLAVINKASGMVVHPGAGVREGTLVNALLFHFPGIEGVGAKDRSGIVHRLDKEASGVMVVALTERARKELQRQFKKREVEKTYLCLVHGKMPVKQGKIDWPIGRHVRDGHKMSVKTKKPRAAETYFTVQKEFHGYSILDVKPVTGRTHQIRVHLSSAGHPLAGDRLYGYRNITPVSSRLFLHALRLAFVHPEKGSWVEFYAPLPEDLKKILVTLPG